MPIKADLHIHSTVSPCAGLDMSPSKIVERAIEEKLDLIALTDHNSAANCEPFFNLCQQHGIDCFLGIEVTVSEEFHMLALTDTVEKVKQLDQYVKDNQPFVEHDESTTGEQQVIVNEKEEVLGFVKRHLHIPTKISYVKLMEFIKKIDGICIPAHVNRNSFSLKSQLGFIPDEEGFDALETYKRTPFDPSFYPDNKGIVTNSDAHDLYSIGSAYTEIYTDNPSLLSIRDSLRKKECKPVIIKH